VVYQQTILSNGLDRRHHFFFTSLPSEAPKYESIKQVRHTRPRLEASHCARTLWRGKASLPVRSYPRSAEMASTALRSFDFTHRVATPRLGMSLSRIPKPDFQNQSPPQGWPSRDPPRSPDPATHLSRRSCSKKKTKSLPGLLPMPPGSLWEARHILHVLGLCFSRPWRLPPAMYPHWVAAILVAPLSSY
jgi:hypothetical protein